MSKYPLVSFVILNWNGRKRLERCLASVVKVKYPSIEIVVVNNGSTDDSEEFIKNNYPKIKLINLKKNVGYAGGKNIGVSKARGKYILGLDNDTVVSPGFLNPLVEDLENDSALGIVQPQIRSLIDKTLLDSVASFFTFTGFLYHFGYMKPVKNKKYQNPMYAYTIKGACFMIAKKDYKALGGLDASFLSYIEETDLCHRMWLYGKKVLYEPRGVIYHWGGGDTLTMSNSTSSMLRTFRNRYFSYIKNFSFPMLIKILPVHFLMCEMFVLLSFLSGKIKQAILVQWGTICWVFDLPSLIKKRNHIQKRIRKVSDNEISSFVTKNPRLSYYWYLAKDIKAYKD